MRKRSEILNKIKAIVQANEPSATIYLYGSRSKGNARPDSDWDLLILIDKEQITSDIERKISYSLYDLEFDIGEVISPIIYSKREWTNKYSITPFHHNVMKEGIVL